MKTASLFVGIFAAVASSLCCIAPALALLAGTSSLAGSFAWLEPLRPYLLVFTISLLGFAWYQQLKSQPVDSCGCESQKKTFMQTKIFLSGTTLAALLLLTFPSYSGLIFQDNTPKLQSITSAPQTAFVSIKGMTCEGCEHHVKQEVNKLKGIVSVDVSYQKGNATVKYDGSNTSLSEIKKAVDATGYKATSTRIL
ncbi:MULTISPECIES: mercuric transport protein MerTP [Larkinella]|jgi:mercuric ion transport protein|uniref:Mercuric transport protein MerT n=1 Tax=Larkinella punicea TaxID=2315727 RepID=A0A368JK33_9BACT|nr:MULTISPECIES: mercuric transport protein MerTP [Larkinella]RCR67044.1 mercuric transport protein MerTP [Larkinella punicea]